VRILFDAGFERLAVVFKYGTMKSQKSNRYSPEVRESAVRIA
jgi:hypothetical protein